jgi:hypothetical protein
MSDNADLKEYVVTTAFGTRSWWAVDEQHALEQHLDAFGTDDEDEAVSDVRCTGRVWSDEYGGTE